MKMPAIEVKIKSLWQILDADCLKHLRVIHTHCTYERRTYTIIKLVDRAVERMGTVHAYK